MNWYGTWDKNVTDDKLWTDEIKYADLSKFTCASAFGIGDCWPCCILPELKETFQMAIELAFTGRAQALVSSRSFSGLWSLKPEDLTCSWWRENATTVK